MSRYCGSQAIVVLMPKHEHLHYPVGKCVLDVANDQEKVRGNFLRCLISFGIHLSTDKDYRSATKFRYSCPYHHTTSSHRSLREYSWFSSNIAPIISIAIRAVQTKSFFVRKYYLNQLQIHRHILLCEIPLTTL